MENKQAIGNLSALANDTRLTAFRTLIQAGPEGLAAGELARRIGVLPNSLTTNLNILSHAQLVTSRRAGRSVIYSANYDTMRELLAFLMEDCCGGNPEICAPLVKVASQCCDAEGHPC